MDSDFSRPAPKDFAMVGKRIGKGEKYLFLVDTWHSTPVTVLKDKGHLFTETIRYARGTKKALATIKGKVVGKELKDIRISAPPGKAKAQKIE